jgi:hypothetical protein
MTQPIPDEALHWFAASDVTAIWTDERGEQHTFNDLARELLACREALRFYADPSNYETQTWPSALGGAVTGVPVVNDVGIMARLALRSPDALLPDTRG